MEDLGAPSFSLGIDLDCDSGISAIPVEKSIQTPGNELSIVISSQSSHGEEHSDVERSVPDLFHEKEISPRILKRLKRGPSARVIGALDADDDIEEFSSQEDGRADVSLPTWKSSACSTTKASLRGHGFITTQPTTNQKTQKATPSSKISCFANLEIGTAKKMLPRLTISPLRRFQLIDSDSDNEKDYMDKNRGETNGISIRPNQQVTDSVQTSQLKRKHSTTWIDLRDIKHSSCNTLNQQDPTPNGISQMRIANASINVPQIEISQKNLSDKMTKKLSTPALDEFCNEYFETLKTNNLGSKPDDAHNINRPPAHHYFYHSDPRIQKLVRYRLNHFFPLGTVNPKEVLQSQTEGIDYIGQFGQRDAPSQISANIKNKDNEGTSKRRKKNPKTSKESSGVTDGWVDPKSREIAPKDAGKRRVHADGQSSGHWYTAQGGRKVYVTKSGQELIGQNAYRQYRKENRASSRKTKNKAVASTASKRKTKSKK